MTGVQKKSGTDWSDPSRLVGYLQVLSTAVSLGGTAYNTFNLSNAMASSAAPTAARRVDTQVSNQDIRELKSYLQLAFLCILSLTARGFYVQGRKVVRKRNKGKAMPEQLFADIDCYKADYKDTWKDGFKGYAHMLSKDWLVLANTPVRTVACILTGVLDSITKLLGFDSNDAATADLTMNIIQLLAFFDITLYCLDMAGWTITATTVANLAVLFGYKIHETHHPEAVSVEQKAQADSIFRGLPASGQRIVSWLTSAPKRK